MMVKIQPNTWYYVYTNGKAHYLGDANAVKSEDGKEMVHPDKPGFKFVKKFMVQK